MNASSERKRDFVSPVAGMNVVYVIVADRAKFDQIQRPATTHDPLPDGRRVLSKMIGDWSMLDDGLVIFQHWLEDASDEQKGNDK